MKFIRYSLFIVNILAVLALFVSYLSPYISPVGNKFIPLFGLLFPYIFLVNLLFFLGWVFTKWTYSLLSLAALLIGFSAAQRFISFNSPKEIKSDKIIQIASYNIANGSKIGKKNIAKFYGYIEDDLDKGIVFFQESSTAIKDQLRKRFPKNNFVQFANKRATIMCQYPIINSGILDFKDNYNTCVWADIDFNGKKIRIYSVHLQSNGVTSLASNVRNKGEINDPETWNRVGAMMKMYSRSTVKRLDQVTTLMKDIESIDYPVIVGGDFNDVPQSYLYSRISKELQDAFTYRGTGLGTSFNGSIPALRIDYIFADPDFIVLKFNTHKAKFSDHFAISSEFLVR